MLHVQQLLLQPQLLYRLLWVCVCACAAGCAAVQVARWLQSGGCRWSGDAAVHGHLVKQVVGVAPHASRVCVQQQVVEHVYLCRKERCDAVPALLCIRVCLGTQSCCVGHVHRCLAAPARKFALG